MLKLHNKILQCEHTNNPQLVIKGGTDVLLDHFYAWVDYLDGQFHDLLLVLLLADCLRILDWQTELQVLHTCIRKSASICAV